MYVWGTDTVEVKLSSSMWGTLHSNGLQRHGMRICVTQISTLRAQIIYMCMYIIRDMCMFLSQLSYSQTRHAEFFKISIEAMPCLKLLFGRNYVVLFKCHFQMSKQSLKTLTLKTARWNGLCISEEDIEDSPPPHTHKKNPATSHSFES